MKRELGIARCGLACCLCWKMTDAAAAIQGIALIRIGVKTENVLLERNWNIVIIATKLAEKVC